MVQNHNNIMLASCDEWIIIMLSFSKKNIYIPILYKIILYTINKTVKNNISTVPIEEFSDVILYGIGKKYHFYPHAQVYQHYNEFINELI